MNKILVVVDMQNDFIDGALGTPEAQAIVDKVIAKIDEYKENNWHIFTTQDTHGENYLDTPEGKALPVKHCVYNTEGWKLNSKIETTTDYYWKCEPIYKNTFGTDKLIKAIKKNVMKYEFVDEIELVGLCTGICVLANAVMLKAAFYDKCKITVDASCCACVTTESHKVALEAMKLQQINVINEN